MDQEDVINLCCNKVAESTYHDLDLGLRQLIWNELGAKSDSSLTLGHYRRYVLAKRSVEKVLPIWVSVYKSLNPINEVIDISQRALEGRLSLEEGMQLHMNYWSFSDSLSGDNDQNKMAANIVSYTASKLILVGLQDEQYHPKNIDISLSNDSIDPYEFDTALSACYAYSYGGNLDKKSDPLRRKEFWLWWLNQGVRDVVKIDSIPTLN